MNHPPNNQNDLAAFQVTQIQGDGSSSPPHPCPPACLKDDKAYNNPVHEADDEGGADDGDTAGSMETYTMSDVSVVVIDNDDVRAVYNEENNSLHVLMEADVNAVFSEGLGENLKNEEDSASFFSATHSITSMSTIEEEDDVILDEVLVEGRTIDQEMELEIVQDCTCFTRADIGKDCRTNRHVLPI